MTKYTPVLSILFGVAAIIVPHFFGTLTVMLLGGVMLASGILAVLFANDVRKAGYGVSMLGPWTQVIAGTVILVWPELALWLVAVLLGGVLILSGIGAFRTLQEQSIVNPPLSRTLLSWLSIGLGVLLIVMGALGSAILLGMVLGVALIANGLQQWRMGP